MFRKLINQYITRLKGEQYEIDSRIPLSYLSGLLVSRAIMKWRGLFCRVRYSGIPFIGSNVTIKAASRMTIGKGITIARNCYIDALSSDGIVFGDNVSLGANVKIECTGNLRYIGKGLRVGNNVGLGSDNFFGCAGGITVGDDTIFGNFVSCHSENHVHGDLSAPIRLQGVQHKGINVGKNCWIGAKVTLLDGANIGDGCIIAAGAVVLAGQYESNGIYGGVPAKLIKFRS